MITLNDIQYWEKMEAEIEVPFDRDVARSCTLDFNTSKEVNIYIWLSEKPEPQLLCNIKGRETVKFVVPGAYGIMHRDPEADVFILTRDGKTLHRIADADEEAYTTLHEDVPQDPHLKAIEDKMFRKMERRQEQVRQEIARLRDLEKRLEGKISNGSGVESEAGSEQTVNAQTPDPAGGGQVADEGSAVGNASVPDSAAPDVQDDGTK